MNDLAFVPQSNILASGGDDRRILLWDTFSLCNEPIKSIPTRHKGNILTMAIDCKGQRIISAGASGCTLLHDLQTGKEEGSFDGMYVWKGTHPSNKSRNFVGNLCLVCRHE